MRARLLIFVALCGVALGQVTVTQNAWVSFPVAGFAAETVGYDSLVFVPGTAFCSSCTDRFVWLGKYHQQSSEPNYSMNAWSYDENRYDVLDLGHQFMSVHNMEGGHPNGTLSLIPAGDPYHANNLIMWGGQSNSNQSELVKFLWLFDLGGRTGKAVVNSGARPGTTANLTGSYDSTNHVYVAFPDSNNRVIIFDPSTGLWTEDTATVPAGISGYNFVQTAFNSSTGEVFLFGGDNGNSSCGLGYLTNSSVYAYNYLNRSGHGTGSPWRTVATTGPTGRIYAGFAYDPDDNLFLMVGGQYYNGTACVQPNDTWELTTSNSWTSGSWTQLSPTTNWFTSGVIGQSLSFWKLAYYSGRHTFVMMDQNSGTSEITAWGQPYSGPTGAGGVTWSNYPTRTWVYCLPAASCTNVGTVTKSYNNPPAGPSSFGSGTAFNRLVQGASSITPLTESWGSDPSAVVSGGTLGACWEETNGPFDASGSGASHQPYCQALASLTTGWSVYGNSWNSIYTGVPTKDSELTQYALINNVPWVCWSQQPNGGNAVQAQNSWCKYYSAGVWNNSATSTAYIGVLGGSAAPAAFWQSTRHLITVGTLPTVAVLQINGDVATKPREAFVAQCAGFPPCTWVTLGAKLNVPVSGNSSSQCVTGGASTNNACTFAEELRIATDGTNLWSVWSQYPNANSTGSVLPSLSQIYTAAQLYVAKWNGSAWVNIGPSGTCSGTACALNQNTSNWAVAGDTVSAGGNLFITWTERTATGNAQVYLQYWNGTAWTFVGPSPGCSGTACALNNSTSLGYGFRPRLATDGTSIYVAWEEQQAGAVNKIYVTKCSTSSCSALGSSLNIDSTNGAARNLSVTTIGSNPMVLWQEIQLGQLAQIYGKQWNGSAWVGLFPAPTIQVAPSAPSFALW